MSKKAFIKVVENAKKRKNEYFVKNFDITESVELLLEEVKKDYEFKKQVELQFGLNTCNETLEKQAKKYGKEISELREQLALLEKALELACEKICENGKGIISWEIDGFKNKAKGMMKSE